MKQKVYYYIMYYKHSRLFNYPDIGDYYFNNLFFILFYLIFYVSFSLTTKNDKKNVPPLSPSPISLTKKPMT